MLDSVVFACVCAMSPKRRFQRCSVCGLRDPFSCKLKDGEKCMRMRTYSLQVDSEKYRKETVAIFPQCRRYQGASVFSYYPINQVTTAFYNLFNNGDVVQGRMSIDMHKYEGRPYFISFKWKILNKTEDDSRHFFRYINDIIYRIENDLINSVKFVSYQLKQITFRYSVQSIKEEEV